jgi:hypothetical protein
VNLQAAATVVRDLVVTATGVFGVIHEELTGRANPYLLLLYAVVLQVPGAIGLFQAIVVGKQVPTGTTSTSSPSPVSLPPSQ